MRAAALVILVTILTHGNAADAAEVRVFTSRAIATVLEKIGPEFERTTGHKLNVVSGFGPDFVKQINAGEPFDVLVSPPPPSMACSKTASSLPIAHQSRTVRGRRGGSRGRDQARHQLGRGIQAGAAQCQIVGYLPTGGVPQLIERLGITDALKSKVTIPDTDIVSELVAKGELELGVVVITQILTTPGVELVGPIPPEI